MTLSAIVARGDVDALQIFIALAWLAGAMFLMAGAVALVRRWFRRSRATDEQSADTLLSQLRDARDRGELSPEEFQKIRGKLNAQLRSDLDSRKS